MSTSTNHEQNGVEQAARRAVDPSDARWIRLREIVSENSLKRGDFTLT
jgi:hypothetical protein